MFSPEQVLKALEIAKERLEEDLDNEYLKEVIIELQERIYDEERRYYPNPISQRLINFIEGL